MLVLVSWIVGFALLQQQVNALDKKVSQYPSEDWFRLKFETIDESFTEINKRLDNESK